MFVSYDFFSIVHYKRSGFYHNFYINFSKFLNLFKFNRPVFTRPDRFDQFSRKPAFSNPGPEPDRPGAHRLHGGRAYFVAADKKILSLARRHSFEQAPDHLKKTSYQGVGRPHPAFFRP
ncbi:hypothetical protein PR202_ga18203 [Eleusine coracana subsp. coracana]|uniref:Uncharacterized protein n=1 Tax=Eleusine coracana subsp. coracana TaxID=191504 RepID=A0AAV5CSK8_ELECO|nr:hypothetical protein PR202_ga18203 [Eleusine coracana subsp. coracana]